MKRAGLVLLSILLLSAGVVLAQSTDEAWTAPINLSQSGTASEPRMVVDSSGRIHVLWLDSFLGPVYTEGNGSQWDAPAAVMLPSGDALPQLVADGAGQIHAFWQAVPEAEVNNREAIARLYHSQVAARSFATTEAWSPPQELATAVLNNAVAVDTAGRLHLAMIRSSSEEAGLYYLQSGDGGTTWTLPENLYQSAYFRLLDAGSANVQITSSGSDGVFIAWDNQPREQVFVVRSGNSGQSWSSAREVDRRQETDSFSAVGPSNIRLAVQDSELHLTWQAGHEGLNCAQYHQWSVDGGITWQPAQHTLDSSQGCPADVQFITAADTLFLLVRTESGLYLLGWSGSTWGDPELESDLTAFTDPDTFRQVTPDCGQVAVTDDDRLLFASCSSGSGQDVWFTVRSLAALSEFLQVTPIWSTPAAMTEGEGSVFSPVLLADSQNGLHAFWTQAAAPAGDALFAPAADTIDYAHWDGTRWSIPSPILSSLGGKVEQLAVALHRDGRLLVVWGGQSGQVYFSWASAARATIASEWTEPVALSALDTVGSTPDILIDRNGIIYVVYVIPLNEGRGVYLVTSTDGGESWSEPARIFDAIAAGWEAVDRPRLVQTVDDHFHLLWFRRSLPSAVETAALFYARSDDAGLTWSEPAEIKNGTQQNAPVVWSQILSLGDRALHRAWQEWDGRQLALWHQYSLDDGLAWSRPARVSGFGVTAGPAAIVADTTGVLHLVQLMIDDATGSVGLVLQHWLWQAESWLPVDSLEVQAGGFSFRDSLAAAVGLDGRLAVVYTGHPTGVADAAQELFFAAGALDLSIATPMPLPTLTPTPTSTPAITPMPGPQPTPTLVFPTEPGNPRFQINFLPGNMGTVAVGVLMALIPAALLAVIGLFVHLRFVRNRR